MPVSGLCCSTAAIAFANKAKKLVMAPSTLSSPSSTTPKDRLANISAHMAAPLASVFPASSVPQAPEDPLFGLMAAYRKDTFAKKVDLGIGAYRDDDAKPWVLPVVTKARLKYPCG